MALIKSVSGIKGTIGGQQGNALTPLDIVKFAGAYSVWIKNRSKTCERFKVVIGRDARLSGDIRHRTLFSECMDDKSRRHKPVCRTVYKSGNKGDERNKYQIK